MTSLPESTVKDWKFIGLHRDAAAIKPVNVMGHESNLKAGARP